MHQPHSFMLVLVIRHDIVKKAASQSQLPLRKSYELLPSWKLGMELQKSKRTKSDDHKALKLREQKQNKGAH